MTESDDSSGEDGDGENETPPTLNRRFQPVVKKVRTGTKAFRQSPVRNDTLQKYVKETHGKELNLIMDTKTRWHTLLAMFRRFHLLSPEIQKALIDLALQHLFLSEDELKIVRDLIDVLETIEIGAVKITSNDFSLLDADHVIEFMLKKMEENASGLGQTMLDILHQRLMERCNGLISGVLLYLSPNKNADNAILKYPPKNEIIKKIRDIYVRLFWSPESNEDSALPDSEAPLEPAPKKSKAEELKDFLQSRESGGDQSKSSFSSPSDILVEIKREFAIFEATGQRPLCLERVYKAASTLPPTSVEAERAFSAAGLFVSKVRASLSDESVDNLCFLRNYLKKL